MSQGFGERGELAEWIPAEHKPALPHPWLRVGQGCSPAPGTSWRHSSEPFAGALSLLTWEPRAEAPRPGERFVAVGTLSFRHFKPSGAPVSHPGKGSAPHVGSPNPPAGSLSPSFSLNTSLLPHPSPWLPIFAAPGL